jgi:hypothetical protein
MKHARTVILLTLALVTPAFAQTRQQPSSRPPAKAPARDVVPSAPNPKPTAPRRMTRAAERRDQAHIDTVKDLVTHLSSNGCPLKPAIVTDKKKTEVSRHLGINFADVELYRIGDAKEGGIAISKFKRTDSPARIADWKIPAGCQVITWRNFLVVKCCTPAEWDTVIAAAKLEGALTGESPRNNERRSKDDAREGIALTLQDTLSNQLELFAARNKGTYPDLTRDGWKILLKQGYLKRPPANPFCPPTVATKVVEGKSGSDVDTRTAGWVYDKAEGLLYATGLPE